MTLKRVVCEQETCKFDLGESVESIEQISIKIIQDNTECFCTASEDCSQHRCEKRGTIQVQRDRHYTPAQVREQMYNFLILDCCWTLILFSCDVRRARVCVSGSLSSTCKDWKCKECCCSAIFSACVLCCTAASQKEEWRRGEERHDYTCNVLFSRILALQTFALCFVFALAFIFINWGMYFAGLKDCFAPCVCGFTWGFLCPP